MFHPEIQKGLQAYFESTNLALRNTTSRHPEQLAIEDQPWYEHNGNSFIYSNKHFALCNTKNDSSD
jgi:hypothetical protein